MHYCYPCILEVEIDEIIAIQNPELVVTNGAFERQGRASSDTADSYICHMMQYK